MQKRKLEVTRKLTERQKRAIENMGVAIANLSKPPAYLGHQHINAREIMVDNENRNRHVGIFCNSLIDLVLSI